MGNHHINRLGGLQNYGDNGEAHTTGALTYTADDIVVADDVFDKYPVRQIDDHHYLSYLQAENGQTIIELIADPRYQDRLSYLEFHQGSMQPSALEYEMALSGRNRHWFAGVLWGNFKDALEPEIAPINVVSWKHHNSDSITGIHSGTSGPFIQLDLEVALPSSVHLGDWITITGATSGVGSSRNIESVPNCPLRHISVDRTSIIVSYSDETQLPSYSYPQFAPTLGSMKVHFFAQFMGASHGIGVRSASANSGHQYNALLSKGGADVQVSSGVVGSQQVSVHNTTTVFGAVSNGNVEYKATYRVRLENRVDEAAWLYQGVDGAGVMSHARSAGTVKPASDKVLYPRFYMAMPKSMSRIVARVVNIVRTAGVVVVTTDVPHGFAVGDFTHIRGVVNQALFSNSGTNTMPGLQITAATETTFALVWAGTDGSSFGGAVVSTVGTIDAHLWVNQVNALANTILYVPDPDYLSITLGAGSTSFANGEIVLVTGTLAAGGVDYGYDGLWRVASGNGSSIWVLRPIYDIDGNRISPVPSSTSYQVVGGSMCLAPVMRIHDVSVESWTEHRVQIDGQGTARADKALPVYSVGGTINTYMSSSGNGGLHVRPAIAAITDLTSAAITSSATTTAVLNDFGNGFQVSIPVTAVSGTNPTMDVRIEESFDSGTNWVTLYDFQRITATGSYNSPVLRATGRHIRYVQTVGGTSPSFTRTVIRNNLPGLPAEPQKRQIDRTIVPNTLNSVTPTLFMGAANNVQLAVNMAAITTTAPVIKLQGSEDSANWFDIDTGLLTVANSTVEKTINARSCTFIRGIVSTAGVGATLGYVSIKAWS